MEEAEVPTEGLQEEMHHAVSHAASGPRWLGWVPLSSAVFAALAAVSSLLSGHHANEAMIEQLRASDHWAQYQAKSIKATVLSTLGGKAAPAVAEKIREYGKDQAEISAEARHEEAAARDHLATHQILARAVTFSQIAIAIAAIAVLSRKRRFWWLALACGLASCAFLAQGLLHAG